MLASPRVLRDGKIALDVGGGYHAPVWSPSLSDARAANADSDTVLRAAVVHGATPAGPLTYFSGRGGFGDGFEGSIALIGRIVRIGVRRQFVARRTFSLTGGLAGRFAFMSGAIASETPRITAQEARLYGAELSLLGGYTQRDAFELWVGARVGYLFNDASFSLAPGADVPEARTYALGAHRLEAALHLGGRVLLGRFAVALELESAIGYATGDARWSGGSTSQSALAFALTPSGAVSYHF